MHDVRELARDPEAFARRLGRRGDAVDLAPVVALAQRRRALITEADQLRHDKAQAERAMRQADKQSPAFDTFRGKMRSVAAAIKGAAEALKEVETQLAERLMYLPNVPACDAPDGADERENRVERTWGSPPEFDFPPRPHWEIGEALGILDFNRAAKLSGARFVVYRAQGARLERALAAFMLDLHTSAHGYTEVLPPFLVTPASMIGTGQFPKFRDEAFVLERDELVLIPTAEVPVTNLHRDEILPADALPLRYCAYSSCFRREAGSYGRDTRGLIRQHQFQKVELVELTAPEQSDAALERMTRCAEKVLERLGLHHRRVQLCCGDLGFSAARTFDLEVWLPGRGGFAEISSCSNCGPFQARRAAIRYRAPGIKKPQLVHTLNGSALAVGRTLVAILENFQRSDGSVALPDVLWPYMGAQALTPASE